MRRLRVSLLLLAMVGAAALTACGGDSSEVSADQESDLNAITQVGRDMEAAFAQRGAERFCSFVDPEVIDSQFKSEAGCAKRVSRTFEAVESDPSFSFTDITLDEDYAVATGSSFGELYFRKVDGDWLMSRERPVSDEALATDPATDEAAIRQRAEQVAAAVTAGNARGFCEQYEPEQMKQRFGNIAACVREFRPSVSRAADAVKQQGTTVSVDRVEVNDGNRAVAIFTGGAGQVQLVQISDQWYMALPTSGPGS